MWPSALVASWALGHAKAASVALPYTRLAWRRRRARAPHAAREGPAAAWAHLAGRAAAGAQAAHACGLSRIAQARAACGGDLDRVMRVVKLTGFVNSTPDFTDQPKVINGCSDLMVAVFGAAGRHARAAVSANSLPLGVAVEIEAVFELR